MEHYAGPRLRGRWVGAAAGRQGQLLLTSPGLLLQWTGSRALIKDGRPLLRQQLLIALPGGGGGGGGGRGKGGRAGRPGLSHRRRCCTAPRIVHRRRGGPAASPQPPLGGLPRRGAERCGTGAGG